MGRLKSNRDYMCLKCWTVFTYEQVKLHKEQIPSHGETIITSKMFASEEKFLSLAKSMGKIRVLDGEEYIESPYSQLSKNKRRAKDLKFKITVEEEEEKNVNQNSKYPVESP